jgi:hypothetical protein
MTSGKKWVLVVAGALIFFVVYYFMFATYSMSSKPFDLRSAHSDSAAFADPVETFVAAQFDSAGFHELTNEIKKKEILLVEGWDREIAADHFFVRGYKRFKKPFLKRLFAQFDYWYVIFEVEYTSKQVFIKYDWLDGDEKVPVSIQNYTPSPSDDVAQKAKEIYSQLEQLVNQFKRP